MSDFQVSRGHWQASDGKWYPPDQHPDPAYRASFASPPPGTDPKRNAQASKPAESGGPRGPLRLPAALIAAVGVLALAGAGVGILLAGHRGPATHDSPADAPPANRAATLDRLLPPGFMAGDTGAGEHVVVQLQAGPVPVDLDPRTLHSAPIPTGDEEKAALAQVFDLPVAAEVESVLVNAKTLSASSQITVAAANLPTSSNSTDVRLVLQGPSYRAERLVGVNGGVAAAVVTLPSTMAPGTWYIGIEDLAALGSTNAFTISGTATVAIGEFTVQ